MRSNVKLSVMVVLLFGLSSVIVTAPAAANQLVNPRFDDGPVGSVGRWGEVVSPDFSPGFWGAEASEIVTMADCGFAARSAPYMLEMHATSGNYTEAWQVIHVSAPPPRVTLSAWVNSCATNALFYIEILTYNVADGWDTGHTSITLNSVYLDSDPDTWEQVRLDCVETPDDTEWILVNMLYFNDSLADGDGYVDDVRLSLQGDWDVCDLNNDGYVGFCDELLMAEDMHSTYNSRSDFNCDGIVNLSDLAILNAALCEGTQPDPVPSDATIELRFLSTQSNTINAGSGELVTIQVVARNIPDIVGYAFKINIPSGADLIAANCPTGFVGLSGNNNVDQCVRGTTGDPLPAGDRVLMEYNIIYMAGDDRIIELVGLPLNSVPECAADPCGYPSFMPDDYTCAGQWNYFKHSARAVINPTILWGTTTSQTFHISGVSDGDDFPIGIRKRTNRGWIHWDERLDGLPPGVDGADFAAVFVQWINDLGIKNQIGIPIEAKDLSIPPLGKFEVMNVHLFDTIELGSFTDTGSPYVNPYAWTTVLWVPADFNPTLMEVDKLTSIIPERAELGLTNSPNPFNPLTNFNFSLEDDTRVELVVYDLRGRKVRTVIDAYLSAGDYTNVYSWDGRDDSGRVATSGTYLYRFVTDDGKSLLRKMTLLK